MFSFWVNFTNELMFRGEDGIETAIPLGEDRPPADPQERFDWSIAKLIASGLIASDGKYNLELPSAT